jgi:hypothetical protein
LGQPDRWACYIPQQDIGIEDLSVGLLHPADLSIFMVGAVATTVAAVFSVVVLLLGVVVSANATVAKAKEVTKAARVSDFIFIYCGRRVDSVALLTTRTPRHSLIILFFFQRGLLMPRWCFRRAIKKTRLGFDPDSSTLRC